MRCVVMLASEYGLQCFNAIKELEIVEIVGVLTPKQEYELKCGGQYIRKMKNGVYNFIVQQCRDLKIPIYVMDKMNHPDTIQNIQEWKPDLIIVSGWYHLIGKEILEIPIKGVIGLHASLLPKYRGGSPLVWQLINGERCAGITLFYITYIKDGVDAGDVIEQKEVKVEENDTIGTLYDKIGKEGIKLLMKNLPLIALDIAPRIMQMNLSDRDIYPQRSPQDGLINWTKTSRQIYDFVRAQTKPYPGAFTYYQQYKVIIWSCEVIPNKDTQGEAGVILNVAKKDNKSQCIVSTGDSEYAIMINEYLILNENNQEIEDVKNLFRVGGYMVDISENL